MRNQSRLDRTVGLDVDVRKVRNTLAISRSYREMSLPSLLLRQVMESWVQQSGFPLVTVTRQYGDNTALVTQRRFLRDKVAV